MSALLLESTGRGIHLEPEDLRKAGLTPGGRMELIELPDAETIASQVGRHRDGEKDTLMATLTATQHIVATPGVAGGKPRIDGHRIKVQDVAVWHERLGLSVDEIVADYDLTPAQVHAALAYYFDHREEIDRSLAEDEQFADSLRQKYPSRVAERLRRLASSDD